MKHCLRLPVVCAVIGLPAFFACHAQADEQKTSHRIGFVAGAGGYTKMAITNQTFFDALSEAGYIRDNNLEVVFRTADGDMKKMPSLVKQALEEKVEILVVSSSPGCTAAKAETTTVPVLCISVQDDPIKSGLTSSLSKGAGNLVGVHSYLPTGIVEQIHRLQELRPQLNSLAILHNPENVTHDHLLEEWKVATNKEGIRIISMPVTNATSLERAINESKQQGAQLGFALLGADTYAIRGDIAKAALENKFPIAMDTPGGFTDMGGIATIGVDIVPLYRRGAIELMIPMLEGKHPSELPWIGPVAVTSKVNHETAKVFNLPL